MVVIPDTAMLADLCAVRDRNGSFCADHGVVRNSDITSYGQARVLPDGQDNSGAEGDPITY